MGGVREGCNCWWCQSARAEAEMLKQPIGTIGSILKIKLPDDFISQMEKMYEEVGMLKTPMGKMEQKPMTREQAIEKAKTIYAFTQDAIKFVNAAEALGLLKFDEPAKPKAEDVIKRAKEYLATTPAQGRETVNLLLDIIDNKYDDVKTVRIGENHTIYLEQYGYSTDVRNKIVITGEIKDIHKQ